MCYSGIKQLVHDLRPWALDGWWPIQDGFAFGQPERAAHSQRGPDQQCPGCGRTVVLVRRELVTEAYCLPDVAVFQALYNQSPCIALGVVGPGTTGVLGTRDELARWQGLLWHLYQVAFVVLADGDMGEWCPAQLENALSPRFPSDFPAIADQARAALARARREGLIPAGYSSRSTEPRVVHVLGPTFAQHRYVLGTRGYVHTPYHGTRGHPPDGVFVRGSDGTSIAVEVKVDEDWDHPLVAPLMDLMGYDAVLTVRVPPTSFDRAADARKWITAAEAKLEETGRARFIYVWPE